MGEMIEVGAMGFFLGGIGIFLGGMLVAWLHYIRPQIIPFIITISVGITISILLLDIVPTSIRNDGILISLLGLLLGSMLIGWVARSLHHKAYPELIGNARYHYLISALIIAVAIGIHNFPVGVALGTSLMHHTEVSWQLSIVMVVHALPEGIALALPILLSGAGISRIGTVALFVALPTGIGAVVGYASGMLFTEILAFLLSFAAGSIIIVSYQEIAKPAFREIGVQKGLLGVVYGWMLGLIFLFTFHANHM